MSDKPSPDQVHAMCAYLATGCDARCMKCPAETHTKYGPGEPGCYGIALETLQKAREILEGGK